MQSSRKIHRKKGNRKGILKVFGNLKLNRSHFILLVVFTLIGAYLRLEPLLFDTVHFSYDQGVDISYVRALVEENKISLIGRFTGLEGVFMGPVWTWILAVPYVFSGGDPNANALFMSIIGVISIWIAYFIIKRMLSETEALLVAYYVAFSGGFLSISHIVLSPYLLMILMIPYLWFLWEIVEHKNDDFWIWLGLFAGLFFQFEIGFAVFLVPSTFIVLAIFTKRKISLNKPQLIGLGLFFATFLPQILFEFRHDFLMSRAVLRFIEGENTSLGTEGLTIAGRAGMRIGTLWEDYSTSVAFRGKNILLTAMISIPAIAGWQLIVKSRQRHSLRLGSMLLLLVVGMYGGFTLYSGPVWVWYRAGLPIVFILLAVIGWASLMKQKTFMRWIAAIVFIALAIIGTDIRSYIQRIARGHEGGVASIKNQKLALDTIFQDAKQEPFDLYVYTPPIYTYVWDHMLHWYAQPKFANFPKEYGYQRSESTDNDFYLMIEPDDFQYRIDGWKGNFESHGKPVKDWQLPGDIRIEKWESLEETK